MKAYLVIFPRHLALLISLSQVVEVVQVVGVPDVGKAVDARHRHETVAVARVGQGRD